MNATRAARALAILADSGQHHAGGQDGRSLPRTELHRSSVAAMLKLVTMLVSMMAMMRIAVMLLLDCKWFRVQASQQLTSRPMLAGRRCHTYVQLHSRSKGGHNGAA